MSDVSVVMETKVRGRWALTAAKYATRLLTSMEGVLGERRAARWAVACCNAACRLLRVRYRVQGGEWQTLRGPEAGYFVLQGEEA